MPNHLTPGVYRDNVFIEPAAEFRTGVPVFLGLIKKTDLIPLSADYSLVSLNGTLSLVRLKQSNITLLRDKRIISQPTGGGSFFLRTALHSGGESREKETDGVDEGPQKFTLWDDFKNAFKGLFPPGYLAYAVHGFFENGGPLCYVQIVCYEDHVNSVEAIQAGLDSLQDFDEFDLICAPDIMWPAGGWTEPDKAKVQQMQRAILEHCHAQGDRFAILDALPSPRVDDLPSPNLSQKEVLEQREGLTVSGNTLANGALYHPWIKVAPSPGLPSRLVPPCGHIAGVFARSDLRVGVRKAPANEILEGVLDLEINLTADQQGPLNEKGINCLRSFPGRGIRVWGARTLSDEPFWRYVNVRRLFLTAARWIDYNMAEVVFEPQSPQLWARIVRDLTIYFGDLYRRGGLKGDRPEEAFYVKCDAELNPPEVQATGMVIAEIWLAPTVPAEFIVVRLIRGPAGLTIIGPA